MNERFTGSNRCQSCAHYSFYLMITSGSYGYAGKIPCLFCTSFSWVNDNYAPSMSKGEDLLPKARTGDRT